MLTTTDEAAFAPTQRFRKPITASASIFIPGTTRSMRPLRILQKECILLPSPEGNHLSDYGGSKSDESVHTSSWA
jgi:hypothetical protein